MESQPASTPAASADAAAPVEGTLQKMIDDLVARRGEIKSLVILLADTKGGASVKWSVPISPAQLSHLSMMFQTKLGEVYRAGMGYSEAPARTHVAAVKGDQIMKKLPRVVRRQIEQQQKREAKRAKRVAR